MKKIPMIKNVLSMCLLIILLSCSKENDTDEAPTTGILQGRVTAINTGEPLEGTRIVVFDANTNAPAGATHWTDSAGFFSIELVPGTYVLKLSKQGYESIPAVGMSGIPWGVSAGNTTETNFQMAESVVANGCVISGTVKAGDNIVAGVLVVAENFSSGFSSVTDADGKYYIVNVPSGDYAVKGWYAGYNSSTRTIMAEAGSELTEINLELSNDAQSTVSGAITFLATQNIEVDVSLVHPLTKETIPGLIVETTDYKYLIQDVPDGTFIGRASFENDGKVVDPDWIVKNGEPTITVSGVDVILDFSVTGAVSLINPTNSMSGTDPIEVSGGAVQFSWEAYPSASDYVIEVMNANGALIWGGFSDDGSIKNVIIPDTETSVLFNFDGSTSADLEPGKVYRWRIYASKDDNQSSTGWRLISASEDQQGLIRIAD
jgi:hypothetical protein